MISHVCSGEPSNLDVRQLSLSFTLFVKKAKAFILVDLNALSCNLLMAGLKVSAQYMIATFAVTRSKEVFLDLQNAAVPSSPPVLAMRCSRKSSTSY